MGKKKLVVIEGSDNIFRDLGCPDAEADELLRKADEIIRQRKAEAAARASPPGDSKSLQTLLDHTRGN